MVKTVDLLQNYFFVNETTFHYTFPSEQLAMSDLLTIPEVLAQTGILITGHWFLDPTYSYSAYYKFPIILPQNDFFELDCFELLLFWTIFGFLC